MNPEIIDTMVRAAMQVMDNAYVPYGKAPIGACVLASDGTFYTGCNIENANGNLMRLRLSAIQKNPLFPMELFVSCSQNSTYRKSS